MIISYNTLNRIGAEKLVCTGLLVLFIPPILPSVNDIA